jgi:hypothetical protein
VTPHEAIRAYRLSASRLRGTRRERDLGAARTARGAQAFENHHRVMREALGVLARAGHFEVVNILQKQRELLDGVLGWDDRAAKARRRSVRALDRRVRELLTKAD